MSGATDPTPTTGEHATQRAVMRNHSTRVLIPASEIRARVHELAEQIAADLRAEVARSPGPIVLVPIMTGALVLTADLIRAMPLDLSLRLVGVSSYPGRSVQSRGVELRSELPQDLRGAHVLLIDDVLDSGRTLALLHGMILSQRPASLRSCVLLDKPQARRAPGVELITPQYIGFEIPAEFVVGYGLDWDGRFRNLPDVCTLQFDHGCGASG